MTPLIIPEGVPAGADSPFFLCVSCWAERSQLSVHGGTEELTERLLFIYFRIPSFWAVYAQDGQKDNGILSSCADSGQLGMPRLIDRTDHLHEGYVPWLSIRKKNKL